MFNPFGQQSQVIQTADELRKPYDDRLRAMQANNSAGQGLYDQVLASGMDRHILDGALGAGAAQFGGGQSDAMSGIWGSIRPELLGGIAAQQGGDAWNALTGWSYQDTAPVQAEEQAKLDAFNANQKTQQQAYDMMQGGGFAGGVLSGGAQTSMFGTPMVGGLGGLGGYNAGGGFGQPGSQQSTQSHADTWGSGAFGQPQNGGAGGPFSVKNPWSFS